MIAPNKCWAVLRASAGKRLAPMQATLFPVLRRDGELNLSDEGGRAADQYERGDDRPSSRRRAEEADAAGRSHTKPGSLLKDQIPIWI